MNNSWGFPSKYSKDAQGLRKRQKYITYLIYVLILCFISCLGLIISR